LPFRSGDERGSILVVSLVILCILSAFCVHLGRNVRAKLSLVGRLEDRKKLGLAAGNGARDCVSFLLSGGAGTGGSGVATICIDSGQRINWIHERRDRRFRVEAVCIDEESKINVNTADTRVMARLFETAAELDADSALDLACCVVDWRDKDSFFKHPDHGAEDSYYRRRARPYEAKDAPFEVLDELLLVKGMSADVFEKVRDHLTIYGSGKVNINNASREVLLALGLGDDLAEKLIAFRLRHDSSRDGWTSVRFDSVETIVSQLTGFAALTGSETAGLRKAVAKGMFITDSEYFAVRSVGESDDGIMMCQVVSVVGTGGGKVLYWRQDLGTADSVRLWRARGE
jgi:hypothetical protein